MRSLKRLSAFMKKVWRGVAAGADMGNADQSIGGVYASTHGDNDRRKRETGGRGEP
jgi:hypothetical protein